MAMESAKEFVKKMFEDDEFTKELYKKGGLTYGNNIPEDEQNRQTVKVAREMGFDFDEEEYKVANKEYIESLGAWNAVKRLFHLGKVLREAKKESKK